MPSTQSTRAALFARAERIEDVLAAAGPGDGPVALELLEVLASYELAAESHPDALFGQGEYLEEVLSALQTVGATDLAQELRRARAADDPGESFDQEGFRAAQEGLVASVVAYLNAPQGDR